MEPLSDMPGREAFLEAAQERWEQGVVTGEPLTLVLVAIDYFRECGGAAADICRRSVAEVVAAHAGGTACNMGLVRDHQFAVLCDSKTPHDASQLANQIRRDVESLGIKPTAGGWTLTISACVATDMPAADRPFEKLLIAADRGLRETERFGGNQVVVIKSRYPRRRKRD